MTVHSRSAWATQEAFCKETTQRHTWGSHAELHILRGHGVVVTRKGLTRHVLGFYSPFLHLEKLFQDWNQLFVQKNMWGDRETPRC